MSRNHEQQTELYPRGGTSRLTRTRAWGWKGEALAEMECAIGQSIPSDDQMIIGHMRCAAAA